MPNIDRNKAILSRRDALKTLTAITGAVTLSSLPNQWETPLVEVGALPAHAQVSSLGIAKIEDFLVGGEDEQEGLFIWAVLISHNIPAGIAVDEDGLVDMEIRFTFSGGDGEVLLGLAGLLDGDEYVGTTLGIFVLGLETDTVVEVELWLIDQNGRPTNHLTYEFDPSSVIILEGGKKAPTRDDLLKEYKVKVVVNH
jgi:hypothetical protein